MKSIWYPSMAVVLGSAALCAAQEDPNRFSLGLRMGLNIDAKFKESGGGAGGAAIGPATGGGLDRVYDDGFVRRDASGNQGGMTWNWGYQNASQVSGDTLLMHGSSAGRVPGFSRSDDPQWGAELGYERRLGEWSWGKWGVQTAFNWTDVEINGRQAATVSSAVVTDAYPLGGIIPPLAPYAGSFAGPGPVIGDSPTRSSAVTSSVVESKRALDAQVYGWRLGPYLELPVKEWLAVQLSGGLALGVVDSEFRYRDVATGGGTTSVRSGRHSDSDVLAGGYAEAQLSFRVTERASVFTGAQYQYLPDFEQKGRGTKAELELGDAIFVTLGFKLHF
jgi:hypothetical protein